MPDPYPAPGPPTEIIGGDDILGMYAGLAAPVGPDVETPPPGGPPDLPLFPLCPADRYRLVAEIARGGMGVLHRAVDTLIGREVVVKLLRDEFAGRRPIERRFLREARVNGQLQHPGVVPVYDAGRFPDGRPFLILKYVPGRTLEAVLAARTDPAAGRAALLGLVADVAATIAYAHARGVVHRDLKPSNVMVVPGGGVRVLDWGLAKILPVGRAGGVSPPVIRRIGGLTPPARQVDTDPDLESGGLTNPDPGQTALGAAVGTPAYMAPEQAAGDAPGVDERCDVFGLGGLVCAVLTGHPPYTAPAADAVWVLARTGDLIAAHARLRGSGADPAVIDLAVRCLSADPADRPRDAGEVACALAALPTGPAGGLARRAWSVLHFPVRVLQSLK